MIDPHTVNGRIKAKSKLCGELRRHFNFQETLAVFLKLSQFTLSQFCMLHSIFLQHLGHKITVVKETNRRSSSSSLRVSARAKLFLKILARKLIVPEDSRAKVSMSGTLWCRVLRIVECAVGFLLRNPAKTGRARPRTCEESAGSLRHEGAPYLFSFV